MSPPCHLLRSRVRGSHFDNRLASRHGAHAGDCEARLVVFDQRPRRVATRPCPTHSRFHGIWHSTEEVRMLAMISYGCARAAPRARWRRAVAQALVTTALVGQ